MVEELESIIREAEEKMKQAIVALEKQFLSIRTGKASSALVEDIKVNYYNNPTPLNQLATISCPEPRMIIIKPWDQSILGEIEKAVSQSPLNVNPSNDGEIIRIILPELSTERRKELAKVAKQKAEEIRISIRNIRKGAKEEIKKHKEGISEDEVKLYQEKLQKLTDHYIAEVDKHLKHKEEEIMTV